MKTTPILTFIIILLSSVAIHAQGVEDAFLCAPTYYEGTGRSMGMGNATGAMGGDFTAACINPAGLGLYRSAELTFTTGLQHAFSNSSYYGQNDHNSRTNVSIPNFGYVMHLECSNYRPLRAMQFAIGMTRTNDFNYRNSATGLNPNSSMVDAFLQTVEGIDELYTTSDPEGYLEDNYPYDLYPAWRTHLIDRFEDSLGFFFDSPIPQGNVVQNDVFTSRGRSEEYSLALGANIAEKLFLGSSVSLTHIKKSSTRLYTETPGEPGDSPNTFKEWTYQQNLNDTAWGINVKCGLIYFPAPWLRIGAAWHSRNSYSVGESWTTEITSRLIYDNQEDFQRCLSPFLFQSYYFKTPHTFIGSLAFFVGQHGLVTADVDYLDYRTCSFRSNVYSFEDVNKEIREVMRPSANIRLGTEWRLRQFFLRGGLAYYGSPYGFGNLNGSMKKAAAGIGYTTPGGMSWDFAYELSETTTVFTPYQYYVDGVNEVNDITQRRWRNKLVITLKVKI